MNEEIEKAIQYICQRDEEFASRMRTQGVAHAVYKMLQNGGFNLQNLHKTGRLRHILNAFL